MVLVGVGAEVLGAVLSAGNDLIVNPAFPVCCALPITRAQWCGHAGVEEVVEDQERGLGSLDVPVNKPPWPVGAEEYQRAVEVVQVVEVLVLAARGVPVPACQPERLRHLRPAPITLPQAAIQDRERVPGLLLGQPAQRESAARQHGGTDQVPGGEVHVADVPIVVEHALKTPQCLGCV